MCWDCCFTVNVTATQQYNAAPVVLDNTPRPARSRRSQKLTAFEMASVETRLNDLVRKKMAENAQRNAGPA